MVTTCVDGTITDRADDDGLIFDRKSHVEYFQACLKVLPHYYVGLDTTRLSAVYFCTLGLDILGAGLEGAERESVIEFVYSNQLDSNLGKSLPGYCGFVGSSYCGQNFGGCCRFVGWGFTIMRILNYPRIMVLDAPFPLFFYLLSFVMIVEDRMEETQYPILLLTVFTVKSNQSASVLKRHLANTYKVRHVKHNYFNTQYCYFLHSQSI